MTSHLILVRHGQSQWNLENRFTGWEDVDLTEAGRAEARAAAVKIAAADISLDAAYTSALKRAIRTLWIILDELDMMWLPVTSTWKLNERHYGALQGLDKNETIAQYGAEQVKIWRRSYDISPPAMRDDDDRHPRHDARYRLVSPLELPDSESLKLTLARVIPYWEETIFPDLIAGKNIIISAHGNSLRALIKHLEGISDEEIIELNIPNGEPLHYVFDDDMQIIQKGYM